MAPRRPSAASRTAPAPDLPPPAAPVLARPPGPQLGDWNLLRAFLAVYELGTLTAAAQRLGSTQPSVGRHLRDLEGLVGEALFTRKPGRLLPTEAAHALNACAAPMKAAALDAERLFAESRESIAGTVRVAASEVYAVHVVMPMLAPLLAAHPELEIALSVSNRADNLLRRDADIAVRFFRPEQDDLVATQVGRTELGLYAHRTFVARHGLPQGFDLPPGAFVAGFDRESVPLATLIHGPVPAQPVRFRLRTDAILARQAAVESGHALGVYLADVAAERPDLVRVLADRFGQPQEVWLCAHPGLRRSTAMRCVWNHLAQGLRARLATAADAAGDPAD